ncbi:MAG TPA: hypothetical protein VIQ60_13730 [Gemmatimonadaceae bacterium]
MRPSYRSTLALVAGVLACGAAACSSSEKEAAGPEPEAVSLLGRPLHPRPIPDDARKQLEEKLAVAQAAYERTPNDADSIIWLGRRLAYLERYRDAIRVFSEGIEKHPEDSRLYRHRGHRYVTVRELDKAIADLDRAAELVRGRPDSLEEDGAPNKMNIPTSTQQGNIWYHLALAHYLKHDFEKALAGWKQAMAISTNDDTRVAVADWLYMTYRRMGRDAEAKQVLAGIPSKMNVIENTAYHRRLLMYKGEIPPDSLLDEKSGDDLQFVTQGYGVGNWYLYNGQREKARAVFERIAESGYWAAFGYIAAEAELKAWNQKGT